MSSYGGGAAAMPPDPSLTGCCMATMTRRSRSSAIQSCGTAVALSHDAAVAADLVCQALAAPAGPSRRRPLREVCPGALTAGKAASAVLMPGRANVSRRKRQQPRLFPTYRTGQAGTSVPGQHSPRTPGRRWLRSARCSSRPTSGVQTGLSGSSGFRAAR